MKFDIADKINTLFEQNILPKFSRDPTAEMQGCPEPGEEGINAALNSMACQVNRFNLYFDRLEGSDCSSACPACEDCPACESCPACPPREACPVCP